jgi:hypothetical protein
MSGKKAAAAAERISREKQQGERREKEKEKENEDEVSCTKKVIG